MSKPWSDDVTYSIEVVEDIIKSNTDISPLNVQLVGNGWDNIVYLINHQLIIRLVKAEKGIPASISENLVFENLSPMPIPMPKILYKGLYQNKWPWIIYAQIEGQPLYETEFDETPRIESTSTIANFLKALHSEDIEKFKGLRGDTFNHMNVEKRVQFSKDKIQSLAVNKIIQPEIRFEKILDEAEAIKDHPFKPVLCHGDVKSAHLFFKNKKLMGIIDWGDVHIGHPATDLAVAFTFIPPKARAEFQTIYKADEQIWKLAQFRAFFHTLAILEYTHEKGETNRFNDALRSLEWIFQ